MPSTRRKPASSSGETKASLRELTEVSGNGAAALRTLVSVEGEVDTECSKALEQLVAAITAEYNGQLNPGPAQQRYDDLTDHSRNGADPKQAVEEALQPAPR